MAKKIVLPGGGLEVEGVKDGVATLKPAGHARREQLKKRTDKLQETAEILTKESEIYAIDPVKLEDEPEILRHFDFSQYAFIVTNAKRGYAYYWERDDSRMIAWRKGQARMLLGHKYPGWEVVCGHEGQCTGGRHCKCEAPELIQADGCRRIGDVILFRIPLDSYVLIHKRQLMMNKFKEASIPQSLQQFVEENEGLVQVHTMVNQTPQQYFAKQGTPLVRTDETRVKFPSAVAKAGQLLDTSEESE